MKVLLCPQETGEDGREAAFRAEELLGREKISLFSGNPETVGEEDQGKENREKTDDDIYRAVTSAEKMVPLRKAVILIFIHLDGSGINLEWTRMLRKIRGDHHFLEGCTGAVIVDGSTEIYTKAVGREAVLAANSAGCAFMGRPLVEGTGSLENFRVTAKLQNCTLNEAYRWSIRDLICRLEKDTRILRKRPRLLVLHASIRSTSNTMRLWEKVKAHLSDDMDVEEMSLRNGEILDCGGCPFTMCMHFSEKGQCYYGGVIVEKVYPAVERCDGLIMLCPNYNDAVSANLSAFINRLTALYRRRQFYDKSVFGIIVSGYSGGDIVASQLISSLNMNKTFRLPEHFALIETANDPGSIERVEGIDEKAAEFAGRICSTLMIPEC